MQEQGDTKRGRGWRPRAGAKTATETHHAMLDPGTRGAGLGCSPGQPGAQTRRTEEPESERCPGVLLLSPCIPCLSATHLAVRADTGALGHRDVGVPCSSLREVGEGKQRTETEHMGRNGSLAVQVQRSSSPSDFVALLRSFKNKERLGAKL